MPRKLKVSNPEQFLVPLLWLALPVFLLFFRFAGDVVTVGFSLALLWRSISTYDWAWLRKPWLRVLMLLSFFSALVVSPWSAEPLSAFGHSVAYLRWPLFAAALGYWLLPQDHHRRWFEYGLVVAVLFIIGDTTLQYFHGSDLLGHVVPADATRLTGPFKKLVPGTFALRFFFVALACFYLRLGAPRLDERFHVPMLVALMATGAAFEFLTGERMAFLCMLLGSAIVLLMLPRRESHGWAPVVVTAAVAATLLAMFAVSQPKMVERTLGSTVDTIADWGESPYGHTMRRAVAIWLEQSPWLGVGPKVYKGLCLSEGFPEAAARFPTAACQHPHNPYLEWFVSAGPVGGILFLLAIALLLREIWSVRPVSIAGLRPFAVATFVVSFWPLTSAMSIFNGWIMGIVWYAVGWSIAVTRDPAPSLSS